MIEALIEALSIIALPFTLAFIIILISDYLWVVVHEFSHLIAAKLIFGVSEWEMKVWPCKLDGRKVGGYVKYSTIKLITNKGDGLISLAPFMVSILTCILLPICIITQHYILAVIMYGGVMDQIRGSMVKKDLCWDLPHASKCFNIPFWLMRASCLSIVFVSLFISSICFCENMFGPG